MATYDPGLVRLIYGSILLQEFMDGTFIEVESDEDSFMKHIGADGHPVRVRNRNEGGKIRATLQQSSRSNPSLSAMHQLDLLTGLRQNPILLTDLRGNTIVSSSESWILRWAPISFGKEIEGRVWEFDCGKLNQFVGAALI